MGLCIATWKTNHADWNFEFVSESNMYEYVHPRWLPDAYSWMGDARNKKDVVMGALLAAYGGVALDGTIMNFKSITDWWDELVDGGKTFRGYRYEWGETAGWFWMARRDSGVLRRYVSDVTLRMGNNRYGSAIPGTTYLALAMGSMDPILEEIDSSLPVCRDIKKNTADVDACSQGRLYHFSGNPDLHNQELVILDPKSSEHGPELIGMTDIMESKEEPFLADAAGQKMWKDYESKKSNDNFKMAKFFGTGGNWAKAQTQVEHFVKPDGTPNELVNIFGALFGAAGLTPQNSANAGSITS